MRVTLTKIPSYMIITIEVYNDAEDELDVEATDADRIFYCKSIDEAEAALGLIERHIINEDDDEHDKLQDMELDTI